MLSCRLSVAWLSFTYASVGSSSPTSAGMQRTLFTFPFSHPLAENLSRNTMPEESCQGVLNYIILRIPGSQAPPFPCPTLWASLTCRLCRWQQVHRATEERHLGNCQSICIQSIIATSIRQNKNSDFSLSKQLAITEGARVGGIGRLMRKFQLAKPTNI